MNIIVLNWRCTWYIKNIIRNLWFILKKSIIKSNIEMNEVLFWRLYLWAQLLLEKALTSQIFSLQIFGCKPLSFNIFCLLLYYCQRREILYSSTFAFTCLISLRPNIYSINVGKWKFEIIYLFMYVCKEKGTEKYIRKENFFLVEFVA